MTVDAVADVLAEVAVIDDDFERADEFPVMVAEAETDDVADEEADEEEEELEDRDVLEVAEEG